MNRHIDNNGRLVIPIEFRQQLGLENGDLVNMQLKGNKIIITNPKNDIDIEDYIKGELALLIGHNELTIGAREMCYKILEKLEK